MVTRRVSEDLLAATKSSLTRRVTSSLLRFAVKVRAIHLCEGLFNSVISASRPRPPSLPTLPVLNNAIDAGMSILVFPGTLSVCRCVVK